MNIDVWNIINSILSIRTYINTSTILLYTILHSLHSSTHFKTIHWPGSIFCSWGHLAYIWLAGMTLASLITCFAMSCTVANPISIKYILKLCSCFNFESIWKATAVRDLLRDMVTHYFYVYPLYHTLFVKLVLHSGARRHLCWNVWLCMVSILFHELNLLLQCLISLNKLWSNLDDTRLFLPFDTNHITCRIVVFGSIWCLQFAILPAGGARSIVSYMVSFTSHPSSVLDLECANVDKYIESVAQNGFGMNKFFQLWAVFKSHQSTQLQPPSSNSGVYLDVDPSRFAPS